MPTPVFTLRLTTQAQANLAEFSKLYGSPNPRAFAREVLEIMCSGKAEQIAEFNRRLIRAVGEQLTLQLNAPLDVLPKPAPPAEKPPQKARKAAKRGKGATPRRKRV